MVGVNLDTLFLNPEMYQFLNLSYNKKMHNIRYFTEGIQELLRTAKVKFQFMNRQSQKPRVSLTYPLPRGVIAQRTYKYYKTDLKLYMAKRAGSGYSTNPSLPKEYVGKK